MPHTPKSPHPKAFKPKAVAKAASWLVIAQALMLGLKLALVPLLTRLLQPSDFGIVTACMAIIAVVTLVGGSGGWAAALVVFHRDDHKAWRSGYSATLVISGVLSALLWFASEPLSKLLGLYEASKYLKLLAFFVPLSIAAEFLSTHMLCRDLYREDSKIGLAAELLASVCAIITAFWGWGAWALIVQQFMASGVRTVAYSYKTKLYPTLKIDKTILWPLTPYAAKATGAELVNFFGVQYPSLLIAKGLGVTSVGIYGVANRLASLPTDVVMASLSRILVPAIAEISEDAQRAKAVLWSGTANSLLLVPLLFGAAALSTPLCAFILGAKFVAAGPIFAVLCIGKAILTPCAGFYAFFKATNKTGTLFWLMMVRSALMVLGTLVGMTLYGLWGAAVGLALASLPVMLIYCQVVFQSVKITWREGFSSFIIIMTQAAFMAACVYGLTHYLSSIGVGVVLVLVAGISTGGVIYIGLMALTFKKHIIEALRALKFDQRFPKLASIFDKLAPKQE